MNFHDLTLGKRSALERLEKVNVERVHHCLLQLRIDG
jgi:hypothetical protein